MASALPAMDRRLCHDSGLNKNSSSEGPLQLILLEDSDRKEAFC
jgi:hypothetical protein